MNRSVVRGVVLAVIFLFAGVAMSAIVFAYFPDPGSPPSIYDDFSWTSTANGFWHVNAIGGDATIKHSQLTIRGDSVELDRRFQTDPVRTVIVARVRGLSFHKFAIGAGAYHAGTIGLEFDNDGVKCGRGTDFGWRVDIMRGWHVPPANQWVYLEVSVTNPYPTASDLKRAEKIGERFEYKKPKPVTVTCSMYGANGHLIVTVTPKNPPPNAHYDSLDEAFLRTWDAGNRYQVDWFYAGPPSGNPARAFLTSVR